jgi:polar amino acid transport system substrate-binding protein
MEENMKKLFVLLMTCAMLLAFAACALPSVPDAPAVVNPGDSAATEPPDEETPQEETPGLLVMATNAAFPPYEFYEGEDGVGKIVGIDAEIAGLIAQKLGMTLEIMDIEFDSIIAAVQTGKADMGMAGMTVTEERLQNINFSVSYATGVQVVIVKEDGPIQSVDDLFDVGGFFIGVQASTTGDLYATWDLEDEGLATVERYNKGADAVLALTTGKVDCVIIDNEPAKSFVAVNKGLKILDTEYTVEEYAICLAKSNSDLLEKVNAALNGLIADGSVQRIIDNYIPAK